MKRKARLLVVSGLFLSLLLGFSNGSWAEEKLVGYWKFDEESGNQTKDSSGNENHGTIEGAVRVASPWGQAMSFDGIDDYINCGKGLSLAFLGDSTYQAWIKASHTSGYMHIIADTDGWGVKRDYDFEIVGGKLHFYHGNGTSAAQYTSGQSVSDGTWKHVAFAADYPDYYFYVDGNQVKKGAMAFNITIAGDDDANRWIGGGKSEPFKGIMDEVKIYNRALTADEIKKYYEESSKKIGH